MSPRRREIVEATAWVGSGIALLAGLGLIARRIVRRARRRKAGAS
jgi:hypothetical protein